MAVCGHRIFTTDAHAILLKDMEFYLKRDATKSNKGYFGKEIRK